jgi:hypothetical protein
MFVSVNVLPMIRPSELLGAGAGQIADLPGDDPQALRRRRG